MTYLSNLRRKYIVAAPAKQEFIIQKKPRNVSDADEEMALSILSRLLGQPEDAIQGRFSKALKLSKKITLPVGEIQKLEFLHLCICVEHQVQTPKVQNEVGIDLGLKSLATLSNGKKVSNGRYYRMMERKLAKAQRGKKKRQAKTIHAKIKNKRMDDIHKATTKIADENKLIVVGNFGAKKLAKTKMAKSIHDAGTTMFKTMLKYKASARGRWYVEVDETNTTRTCSCCRAIPASAPKGVKGLSVREWVCNECGAIHDRDINAALNILRIGRDALVPEVA